MNQQSMTLDHIRRTIPQIREELGVAPVSVRPIRDPQIYALEKERIFKKVWSEGRDRMGIAQCRRLQGEGIACRRHVHIGRAGQGWADTRLP